MKNNKNMADLRTEMKSEFIKILLKMKKEGRLPKDDIEEISFNISKIVESKDLYNLYIILSNLKLTLADPGIGEGVNIKKVDNGYNLRYYGDGYDWEGYHQVGIWSILQITEKELEKVEVILKKIQDTKTIVTHFGDDLDNKASIYALERFAKENGILEEDENLIIERVPAGKIKEGFLNVDTGGHKGSRFEEDTFVIDGNPQEGIQSASAELARMGIYVPEQIIKLADVVPNKVSPLESRTALSLIRSANGKQIFKIAETELLDKLLTDEQLEEYDLIEAQKKQQEIIDNAVEKVKRYTKELANGEKMVLAPEQIIGGAQIAYELGINYYASVQEHKSGKGSTFAVTSKPGVELPDSIKSFGKELVEKYRDLSDGSSGVFLNPNGQMLVAGGPKNPDFKIDYAAEELIQKLNQEFNRKNNHVIEEIEEIVTDKKISDVNKAIGEMVDENEQQKQESIEETIES